MRVLILEDNDQKFRVVLRTLLRAVPEVLAVRATCVADALKLLADEKYAAAVLDWNLPDGTSMAAIKFCSEHSLPFAIFSGQAEEEVIVRWWIRSTEWQRLGEFIVEARKEQ